MSSLRIRSPSDLSKRGEWKSAEEAMNLIQSNYNVSVQTAAGAPQKLVKAIPTVAGRVKNISIYHLHIEGVAPYTDPKYEGIFRTKCLFIGPNCREPVNTFRADFIPQFLSETGLFFRKGIIPLDVALVQVSPPDKHGWVSLGVSIDATLAAAQSAKHIIAQVNRNMPRTHGEGFLHVSQIDALVEGHEPILSPHGREKDPRFPLIGKHIAAQIPDGAVLQMGIGGIPDAVLANLKNHKNLGIHTEMASDGIVSLIQSGVVNNSQKKVMPGKSVVSFAMGSKKLYDFLDDNPSFYFADACWTNSPAVIRQNPKQVAINSGIEVDLSGQIVSDSIGYRMYSGVGGQVDFMRGAALSEGGMPVLALPSTTGRGLSRIVSSVKPGAGVVTTRAHAHYIATEYGMVNLYGLTIRERAKKLISIAHPKHRADLEKAAVQRFGKAYFAQY